MLFVHALKNAAVPIVTVIGIGVALLIGGAVVTESVFAIPGLGRLTVDAILRRDYPVIQGVVLLFSFVYVLVNLLVDLLLHAVRSEDPLLSDHAISHTRCRRLVAAPRLPDVLPPVQAGAASSASCAAIRPSRSAARCCSCMVADRDLRAVSRDGRPDRARAGQAHAPAVGGLTGSAPTCSAATSIRACSTARASR